MLQLDSLVIALRCERKTPILSNAHIPRQVQVSMECIVISLDFAIFIIFSLPDSHKLLLSMLGHSRWELIPSCCSLRVHAESDKEPSELGKCLLILHELVKFLSSGSDVFIRSFSTHRHMNRVLKHRARTAQHNYGHLSWHLLLMVLEVEDDCLLLHQSCQSFNVVNSVVD